MESKQIFSEGDPRFLRPDDPIWRYVPLRTLFFYLEGLVFIPSVAKLRSADPFEGEFYQDTPWFTQWFMEAYAQNRKLIEDWLLQQMCTEADRKWVELNPDAPDVKAEVLQRAYFEFLRKTRFAWCWFQSGMESAAMWSVYGNQGVAIKTTVGRLAAVLGNTGREFTYARLTYVDPNDAFDPTLAGNHRSLTLRPYFLKRKEYESEQEVRFVTAAAEGPIRGGILLKDVGAGSWISSIRLWPGLTDEEEDCLVKAIRRSLTGADCQRSQLLSLPGSPSAFMKKVMNDLESQADTGWLKGQDGVPAQLKLA